LGQVIDKGFPYDDGDSLLTERIKDIKKAPAGAVLAKLNGENITKEHLISLIKDTTVPVTQSLAQVSSLSKGPLFDNNVSTAMLKNLVTDKPAPITVKLAQTKGPLFDNNVSTAMLKNLVTDKPAPITVKLAQTKGPLFDNNVSTAMLKNLVTDKPAPITVKLAQTKGPLFDNNVSTAMLKNLVTDKPAPITVKLAQTKGPLFDNNVTTSMLKNLVTDKPAPITTKLAQIEKTEVKLAQTNGSPVTVNPESMMMTNTMGNAALGMTEVRVGPDELKLHQQGRSSNILAQVSSENPVWNPPFNNWSVNQPSPPHATGDSGHQDLELRDMIIDGVNGYDLVQTKRKDSVKLAQIIPLTEEENQPGNFKLIEHDGNHDVLQLAQKY